MPRKLIFVECGAPWLEEMRWVEQLMASEPRIADIVAKMTVNAGAQTSEFQMPVVWSVFIRVIRGKI